MSRVKERLKLMELMYLYIINKNINSDFDYNEIIKDIDSEYINLEFVNIIKNMEDIKKIINKYLKDGWTINRLPIIDQGLLYIGIYEMLYTDIPNIVCINEVVELSKNYSDIKVSKMINGIMDKIYHDEEKING